MFQFLTNIYNYFFRNYQNPDSIDNTVLCKKTSVNLYSTLIYKKLQKQNNKFMHLYKDNLEIYNIDYAQYDTLYKFLEHISMISHDIICISNINNILHTYNDGNKYVLLYTADLISKIMDMYYFAGENNIILSRIPIIDSKIYITDELYGNYISQIKICINDIEIVLYNVNITPSIFSYTNHTNTFVASILENNYNGIPCIVTGFYNHNNSFYNWNFYNWIIDMFISKNRNNFTILNTFLSINKNAIDYNSTYHDTYSTQFIYVNSKWCNQKIYINDITTCHSPNAKTNIIKIIS